MRLARCLILAFVFMMPWTIVHAELAQSVILNDSNGVRMSAYAITSGQTVNTQPIFVRDSVGYESLLIKISGDITVSEQVSIDGINWYTPNTTDGTTLTSIGGIGTNLTSDSWIIGTSRLAFQTRFQVTANADSVITFYYIYINQAKL